MLLDRGTGSAQDNYHMKLSHDPADGLLAIIFSCSFGVLGAVSDENVRTAWYSYAVLIMLWTVWDAIYGFAHHYMHTIPKLHKLHMVSHVVHV